MIPCMQAVYLFMFQLTFTMSKVRILNGYISGLCTCFAQCTFLLDERPPFVICIYSFPAFMLLPSTPADHWVHRVRLLTNNYALVFSLIVTIIIEHQ